MKHLLLVVNPVSGDVDKEPFLKQAEALLKKYGLAHSVFKTTGKNDAEKLQAQVAEVSPDRIGVVGGDGTVLFTAMALRDHNLPLGIIPMGSANGLATELGVPKEPKKALLDLLLSEYTAPLDMLSVNEEHYCLHLGDVGVNANIVAAYEQDDNRGMATYARYFIEELKNLDPFPVKVTTEEETVETEGVMVALCNARKYGTGIPLNTVGNPLDGKFEVVIIERVDFMTLVNLGLSKFDERFFDHQQGKVLQTTEATIRFDQARQLQLDGEVIDTVEELRVKLVPGAITLITHRDNPYFEPKA